MNKETLDCSIVGLIYERCEANGLSFYQLTPKASRKMRVKSMDSEDDDRNVVPCYLRRLAIPKPYDFEKNEMGIESEKIE